MLPEELGGALLACSSPSARLRLRTIDFVQKERFEREFIVRALKRFNGAHQSDGHARGGIPKNTLLRKIRKYGINPSDYGPVNQDGE